ncbi:MAG: SDR family NAD(P)-dependent oxidoreductase [Lachnospiraceae bacterium]|nr:SDR family NAD(P)-dependent oxidoreductase [Lachnospiraceae bacterium]
MSKTAMITGASRGIGEAIARELAGKGYELYLTCHSSSERLTRLANELADKHNIECTCFIGDIGDFGFVKESFSEITDLDVLINNAGISYIGLLSEMEISDWDGIIRTNLSSCFYTSKMAIPLMLKKHAGQIINISSVWGNVGASMEVAYSASKGGLNSFTKSLAKELAPSNIQVNAIACGVIDTDMNKHLSMSDLEVLKGEIPADRIGTTIEVAKMVRHVIEAPSYLTGQIITLDGGWQ